MKSRADNKLKQCACCGGTVCFNGLDICLWCQKDSKKMALYVCMPSFCKYFNDGIRFCKCCEKAIASARDIRDWLVNGVGRGRYKLTGDDDLVVSMYFEKEFDLMYMNICECEEWYDGYDDLNEGYIKATLNLSDVQLIESIRTKEFLNDLDKQIKGAN